MKKYLSIILMIGLMGVSLCGCALLLIGGGVAGGVAVSKDTVELNIDRNYSSVWSVTLDEFKRAKGTITLQDKEAGKIEASIEDSKVESQLKQLTPKTVQLQIKARKNLFPNIELASRLSNKISNRL